MSSIPEGYMKNALGHLVPIDAVQEIDRARDDLVRELVDAADDLAGQLAAYKRQALGDVAAFVALSAERYGAKRGGAKGNITITSFDGTLRIQVAIAENVTFDERLQAAKELVDGCIHRWAEGANTELRALVEHAFQVDKEGRVSFGRIMGLRQLKIDDSEWRQAMQAIADSILIVGSKTYIRIYRRPTPTANWEQICLDLAAA